MLKTQTPNETIAGIVEETIEVILHSYWADSFDEQKLTTRLTTVLGEELAGAKLWEAKPQSVPIPPPQFVNPLK